MLACGLLPRVVSLPEPALPMMSDPIRLAGLVPAVPLDRGPALGPDEAAPIAGEITFDEFLQGLNPLHHLPVIGTIYRAATGETVPPAMRVLGGALFGGVVGMLGAAALAAIEEFQPATRLLAAARGEADPMLAQAGPPEANHTAPRAADAAG